MDPASAVGLAAAAAQFLALVTKIAVGGGRAVASARDVPLAVEELRADSANFEDMVKNLNAQLDESSKGEGTIHGSEKILQKICVDCRDASQELRDATEKIAGKIRKRPRVQSLWEALKQQLGGGHLEKLADTLADHQRKLSSITMACLWEDTKRKEEALADMRTQITALHTLLEQYVVQNKLKPGEESDPLAMKLSVSNASLAKMDWRDRATERMLAEVITSWEERDWQSQPSDVAQARLPEFLPMAKKMTNSLRFEEMTTRHDDINPPDESTFGWIWERTPETIDGKAKWSSFPDWLESNDQQTYWITGRPGSGKSTLMRFVEGHPKLQEHLASFGDPNLPLHVWTFYAWNIGNNTQKSIEGLTRSILVQGLASMPELVPVVLPRRWAFETTFRGAEYPSNWESEDMEALEEGLHRFLTEGLLSMRVVILVDGLDEFDLPPSSLIKTIRSIGAHTGAKLCVASRPWTEFRDEFSSSPCLAVHELTANCIQVSIQKRFQLCPAARERPEEVHHLTEKIREAAKGVFQWVTTVVTYIVEELRLGGSLTVMLRIVDGLPKELSLLYTAIWDRIPTERRVKADEVLSWKLASGRLRYEALWAVNERHAKDLDILDQVAKDRRRLKLLVSRLLASQSMGLLEVNSVGEISFMHRTVAEWVDESKVSERDTLESRLALIHGLCVLGPRVYGGNDAMDSNPRGHESWGQYVLGEIAYQVARIIDSPQPEDLATDQITEWLLQLERYWSLPGSSYRFNLSIDLDSGGRLGLGNSFLFLFACLGFESFVRSKLSEKSSVDNSILYICCLDGSSPIYIQTGPGQLEDELVLTWSGRAQNQMTMMNLYLDTYVMPFRMVKGEVQSCTWKQAAEDARHMAYGRRNPRSTEDVAYYTEVSKLLEDRARLEEKQKRLSGVFSRIKAPAKRLSRRWKGRGSGS